MDISSGSLLGILKDLRIRLAFYPSVLVSAVRDFSQRIQDAYMAMPMQIFLEGFNEYPVLSRVLALLLFPFVVVIGLVLVIVAFLNLCILSLSPSLVVRLVFIISLTIGLIITTILSLAITIVVLAVYLVIFSLIKLPLFVVSQVRTRSQLPPSDGSVPILETSVWTTHIAKWTREGTWLYSAAELLQPILHIAWRDRFSASMRAVRVWISVCAKRIAEWASPDEELHDATREVDEGVLVAEPSATATREYVDAETEVVSPLQPPGELMEMGVRTGIHTGADGTVAAGDLGETNVLRRRNRFGSHGGVDEDDNDPLGTLKLTT